MLYHKYIYYKKIMEANLDFNLFLEKIHHNQNFTFKCKIIEEYEHLGYKFMSILINGEKSSKFLRVSDNIQLKDKEITFNINDIKMRLFNGTFYFLIEKFTQEENMVINAFEKNIEISEYIFNAIKIYKRIDEIQKKENHLCSVVLKANEIFDKQRQFEFRDSKGKKIQVDERIINHKYENGRIYCFNGFLYNKESNIFELTIISDIQDYSIDCEKIYAPSEIFESKIDSLINFKGRVTSFNISEQYIKAENNENKNIKK